MRHEESYQTNVLAQHRPLQERQPSGPTRYVTSSFSKKQLGAGGVGGCKEGDEIGRIAPYLELSIPQRMWDDTESDGKLLLQFHDGRPWRID